MAKGRRELLTDLRIKTMRAGEWQADLAARGGGVLQVRKLTDGTAAFYFRYTASDGRNVRLSVGVGISLVDARKRARELSLRYQHGDRDLRESLAAEQHEKERKRREEQEREQAERSRRKQTLGALLAAHVDQLERDGKISASAVRAALHRHVEDAWPKLWATPHTNVSTDDLLAVVARPAQDGKLREAEKLRAYLRAAYAAAIKARHNAKALPALRELNVTANTARDLVPIQGANRARDRSLNLAELRAYWNRIRKPSEYAALRFHLLTGCQRIQQMARATRVDYDEDMQAIRLLDRKGRRSKPRQHYVPLIPAALEAMETMRAGAVGEYIFTVTAGESGIDYGSLASRMQTVGEAMQSNDELGGGPFTPGDLRRTVETVLAGAKVSKEIRGQLQSHGLGGVQDRHYDRHEYFEEKWAALETLYHLLVGANTKVTSIRRQRLMKVGG